MRRNILFSILLMSGWAFAQSSSPDALYERGIDAITGVGPTQNEAEGIDYFRRSAALGFGPSQVALAYYYETGTMLTKDPVQALELYRKAAQVGDPLAAWLTGRIYFLGYGVPRDLNAAQKYLTISSSKNNAYGSYYLGRVIEDHDAAKAVTLYKTAADQGLPQAQYFYAKLLKDGRGVAQDRSTAYLWFLVAADAGYTAALADIGEIESAASLNRDQMTEARAKAQEMEQVAIRAVSAKGCEGWDGEFDEYPTPPPPKLQRFCH